MKADDAIKVVQSAKDLLTKQSQIDANTQKIISMGLEDGIKQEQSSKDLEFKTEQIAKMGKEEVLLVTQNDETKKSGITKRAIDSKQAESIGTQTAEAVLNGVATRNVKSQDEVVKANQADLLIRQKQSLDDSLLKDVLKEASGGVAMLYDAVPGLNLPGTWTDMDKITNKLLSNANANVVVPENTLTK